MEKTDPNSDWTITEKLRPPKDGPTRNTFGQRVALRGDLLAASSTITADSGDYESVVYLFRRSGREWQLSHRIDTGRKPSIWIGRVDLGDHFIAISHRESGGPDGSLVGAGAVQLVPLPSD